MMATGTQLGTAWLFRRSHPPAAPDPVAPDTTTEIGIVTLADQARDTKDWDAAAKYYETSLARMPSRVDLHVQLGHALKELGHFDRADLAYRRYLKAMPEDADIHLQIGHLYNKQGKQEAALEWYQKALQLAPDSHDTARHVATTRADIDNRLVRRKQQRAAAFVDARRWREARSAYRDLVMQDNRADLIGILANVTKECGAFDEALGLYDLYRDYARTQAPALLADVELQVAHLHKAAGDFQSAMVHYIRARDHEFVTLAENPRDSVYASELRTCMTEIYTCFWDPHAP